MITRPGPAPYRRQVANYELRHTCSVQDSGMQHVCDVRGGYVCAERCVREVRERRGFAGR